MAVCSLNLKAQNNDDMQKYMDYMKPGKEHRDLAKMEGEWNFKSTMWMAPETQPQTSEGTATCEMILGGRYSQMKEKSTVMGMEFSGISITGFDNAKKVWVNCWIDNMGTGMMYSEGIYDEATGKINFRGKEVDPITGMEQDFRETFKMNDDKTYTIEMFNTMDRKEYKSMEIVYTRK